MPRLRAVVMRIVVLAIVVLTACQKDPPPAPAPPPPVAMPIEKPAVATVPRSAAAPPSSPPQAVDVRTVPDIHTLILLGQDGGPFPESRDR